MSDSEGSFHGQTVGAVGVYKTCATLYEAHREKEAQLLGRNFSCKSFMAHEESFDCYRRSANPGVESHCFRFVTACRGCFQEFQYENGSILVVAIRP